MSTRKALVLDNIRQHFHEKYKNHSNIWELLDKELEQLKQKPAISKIDLDLIDAKLTEITKQNKKTEKSFSTAKSNRSGYSEVPSGLRSRNRSRELEISTRSKLNLSNGDISSVKQQTRGYQLYRGRLSQSPGVCDNSLYYLSPMDLTVLKKHELIGGNEGRLKRVYNSSFVEETNASKSPPSRASKSFLLEEPSKNESNLPSLPLTQKAFERKRSTREDLWYNIEDKDKVKEREQSKEREKKTLTTEGSKSINNREEHKEKPKNIGSSESNAPVESLRTTKTGNFLTDLKAKMIRPESRNQRKNKEDSERSTKNRRVLKVWTAEGQDNKSTEGYLVPFRIRGAGHQSFQQLDYEEHDKALKKQYSMKPPKDSSDTSLLKFMNADRHTEGWKQKVRERLQKINSINNQQMINRTLKELNDKHYLGEQKQLWNVQNEQLDLREQLTKEAEKFKKMAQKQALDEQIRQNHLLKQNYN